MNTRTIIHILRKNQKLFSKIVDFSGLPGIYAISFLWKRFPLTAAQVKRNQIVYVGKTESSQEKRDAKTHFTSGKTGSSTVRRSVGAILRDAEKLVPLARNDSDYKKGRINRYRFETKSEEIITKWMTNNLGLAFYEFPGSNESLDELETAIIEELKPILNIDRKTQTTHSEREFGNYGSNVQLRR